jgi:uncharacterized protein YcfJ
MEMSTLFKALSLALGIAVAGPAAADSYGSSSEDYDWARVVSVDPIIDSYEEPVYRDDCRREPVEYVEPRYTRRRGNGDGAGGALLGAIIGGVIGNQIGSGDGRRAATAAGAIIGASTGYDNATRGRYVETGARVRRGYEERCETRTDYRREERVVGYDVEYEYNGRTYRTQTEAHPGDRIRVYVHVEAAP